MVKIVYYNQNISLKFLKLLIIHISTIFYFIKETTDNYLIYNNFVFENYLQFYNLKFKNQYFNN